MAQIRPKDFLRPLGYSECFNQRPFHGKQFVICSVWFMSSERELAVDWIRECMLKLSKKHPMLRSCIAEHGGKLHWKEMDEPSMICTVDSSSDWQKAFTKYVGTSFDLEKGPLWRCTLMPNVKVNADGDLKYHFALLVDFHHVIIDGTGVMKLMNEFQDLLAEKQNEKKNPDESETPSLLFPAPFEEHEDAKGSLFERFVVWLMMNCTCILGSLLRMDLQSLHDSQAPLREILDAKNEDSEQISASYMIPTELNEQDTKLVIMGSKKMGVSVHCSIQAASVIAFHCLLKERCDKENGTTLKPLDKIDWNCIGVLKAPPKNTQESPIALKYYMISDAVDFRKYTNESHRFEDLAKDTMKYISKNKDKAALLRGGMYLMDKYYPEISPQFRNFRFSHLDLSNMGNCNYLNRDAGTGLKITGAYLGDEGATIGAFLDHFIITMNNKIHWALLYFPPVTKKDFAEEYMKRTLEILLDGCKRALESEDK